MRSPAVVQRSIYFRGRTTCVSLEDAFWYSLKEIARQRRMTVSDLVAEIGAHRGQGNLSSAIRLFVLEFYRRQVAGNSKPLTSG